MLYFDHNATSPLSVEARDAWIATAAERIGNPSSPHRLGARADLILESARTRLASLLGCDPADIVWTSGATESNNTALHHAAGALGSSSEVWVSAIEHPCVLEPARHHFGPRCRLIPVLGNGVVDLEWVEDQLKIRRPGLVAVMAANNETGVLQPWSELASLLEAQGVWFLCDAVQWLGRRPPLGLGMCGFVSGSGHKFGGPRGIGFLKVPEATRLQPLLRGGGQEDGRRAGTENVAGVASMMAALDAVQPLVASEGVIQRMRWKRDFEEAVVRSIPGAEVVGEAAPRLWNTVSVLMPELKGYKRWVVKLDKLGFAVSTGSACASGKEEPSHVLRAMGIEPEAASRAVRFSAGWSTTEADWEALLAALIRIFEETGPEPAGGMRVCPVDPLPA